MRGKKGERERVRIQESGEKRERTRRKSSLSLFLSLYLDCLAGFPRPRIDNTRPSPRRSFLSLDLFSTLATLVHDHSPRRFFPSNKRLTRALSHSPLSSSLLLFVVLLLFPIPHHWDERIREELCAVVLRHF